MEIKLKNKILLIKELKHKCLILKNRIFQYKNKYPLKKFKENLKN